MVFIGLNHCSWAKQYKMENCIGTFVILVLLHKQSALYICPLDYLDPKFFNNWNEIFGTTLHVEVALAVCGLMYFCLKIDAYIFFASRYWNAGKMWGLFLYIMFWYGMVWEIFNFQGFRFSTSVVLWSFCMETSHTGEQILPAQTPPKDHGTVS